MTERHPSLLRALERVLEIEGADLREVLTQAADVVADEVRADKVDVFVHDRGTDTLVALGASRTPMTERERAAGLDRLPLAAGGRAAAVHLSREPFRIGLSPRRTPSRPSPGEARGAPRARGGYSGFPACLVT